MKRRPGSSGFTLVELLVVIGIIALLISVLMPALTKARVSAVRLKCMSNHRQLIQAVQFYANDNGGYPPVASYTHRPNGVTTDQHVRWFNTYLLGRYVGNRTQLKDDQPSEGPNLPFYCTAYTSQRDFSRSNGFGGSWQNTGIGYNNRSGARIARNYTHWTGRIDRQVKFNLIDRPTKVFVFVDVPSGHGWEKYYYAEPGQTGMGSTNGGLVKYGHGSQTVVSFADGHVETFRNDRGPAEATEQNQGLHAAFAKGEVFHNAKQ